jgi:hypothetical protein
MDPVGWGAVAVWCAAALAILGAVFAVVQTKRAAVLARKASILADEARDLAGRALLSSEDTEQRVTETRTIAREASKIALEATHAARDASDTAANANRFAAETKHTSAEAGYAAEEAKKFAEEAHAIAHQADLRARERHEVVWTGGWARPGVYELVNTGVHTAYEIRAVVTVDDEQIAVTTEIVAPGERICIDLPNALDRFYQEQAEEAEHVLRKAADPILHFPAWMRRDHRIIERVTWQTELGRPELHEREHRLAGLGESG